MSGDELHSLELKISKLLRYGVMLAGAFMLFGWITLLDFSKNPLEAFHDYQHKSFEQSLQSAFESQQWGLLIAYFGLILLISLPLLRVLMTAILFIKQKEKTLAFAAFFVFVVLIISFSLGVEI